MSMKTALEATQVEKKQPDSILQESEDPTDHESKTQEGVLFVYDILVMVHRNDR